MTGENGAVKKTLGNAQSGDNACPVHSKRRTDVHSEDWRAQLASAAAYLTSLPLRALELCLVSQCTAGESEQQSASLDRQPLDTMSMTVIGEALALGFNLGRSSQDLSVLLYCPLSEEHIEALDFVINRARNLAWRYAIKLSVTVTTTPCSRLDPLLELLERHHIRLCLEIGGPERGVTPSDLHAYLDLEPSPAVRIVSHRATREERAFLEAALDRGCDVLISECLAAGLDMPQCADALQYDELVRLKKEDRQAGTAANGLSKAILERAARPEDSLASAARQGPVWSRCRAGIEMLAVAPDGVLYPCRDFIRQRRSFLGHTVCGVDRARREQYIRAHVLARSSCSKCTVRAACGGPCKVAATCVDGTVGQIFPAWCRVSCERLQRALPERAGALASEALSATTETSRRCLAIRRAH